MRAFRWATRARWRPILPTRCAAQGARFTPATAFFCPCLDDDIAYGRIVDFTMRMLRISDCIFDAASAATAAFMLAAYFVFPLRLFSAILGTCQ